MANKKPSKNVLDYDPLAWLGEAAESDAEETASEPVEKVVKKKTASKSVVKKKAARKKSPKTTAVKKSSVKKAAASTVEANDMSQSNEEDQGFGFFDEEPEAIKDDINITQAAPETEAEDGFGFFVDIEEKVEQESEDDTGYGFFDTSEQLTSQSVELDRSTNIINLGAELTIRSVSACKALIDENLDNGFEIKLAAAELQKIDTAGLQLIFSLHKTLEKTSQSIIWESSNSIINDAAQLIGMPKLLESSDNGAFGFFDEEIIQDNQSNQQDDSAYGLF